MHEWSIVYTKIQYRSFCKQYLQQAHPFGSSYAIYIVDKDIGNLINPFMHTNFMD